MKFFNILLIERMMLKGTQGLFISSCNKQIMLNNKVSMLKKN